MRDVPVQRFAAVAAGDDDRHTHYLTQWFKGVLTELLQVLHHLWWRRIVDAILSSRRTLDELLQPEMW